MNRIAEHSAENNRRKEKKILTDTMARSLKPGGSVLTDRTVRGLKLLPTSRKGRGYWFLYYISPATKKRRELSLGTYPEVSISEARERANEARKLKDKGIDPLQARQDEKASVAKEEAIPTFEAAARTYIDMRKPAWKNAKHAEQWTSTLETYVFPFIGNLRVDKLKAADFAKALSPIWLKKAETAMRVKQRCESIIKWCWAQDYVENNVVSVVAELLPDAKDARRPTNFPAMRFLDVPNFVNAVLQKDRLGNSRPLLEWVILTAARSGECRKLTWAQVDLENAIWNIPPDNTKTNRSHSVPLAIRCMDILEEQKVFFKMMFGRNPGPSDLVFPSPYGKVYSDMALSKFMKDHKASSDTAGRNAVPHGFRTSFRGWATVNQHPEHLIESCLAHEEKSKTVRAYKREGLIELRRPIMQAYADYIGHSE